jgi:hypothetical protein
MSLPTILQSSIKTSRTVVRRRYGADQSGGHMAGDQSQVEIMGLGAERIRLNFVTS